MDWGSATTFPAPSNGEPTGFTDDWKDTCTYQNAKALKVKANSLTGASYDNTKKLLKKKKQPTKERKHSRKASGLPFTYKYNTV